MTPGNGGVIPPVEYRWKKGQCGNPGGIPKGHYPVSHAYNDMLAWDVAVVVELGKKGLEGNIPDEYRRKIKPAHLIAAARFACASDKKSLGGTAAAIEIADRTEGKVTQKTQDVTMNVESAAREVYERIQSRLRGVPGERVDGSE